MRKLSLAVLLTGGLAATALAQTQDAPAPAPAPVFAGTYHVATGTFTPATSTLGPVGACGQGLLYNESALSGFFYATAANGNTLIDEGIIPNTLGGGPADVYQVHALTVAYATNNTAAGGVALDISIWEAGVTSCGANVAALGAPTATVSVAGLPGSVSGNIEAYLVRLDLTGGSEFDVAGTDGATPFNYGLKYIGQEGTSTGPLIAGDPNVCAAGAGTFADTGIGCDGVGSGSGLGSTDLFVREADGLSTTGCFFFGGYPANVFASFFMQIDSSPAGDLCAAPSNIGAFVGTLAFDTTCASTSVSPCGPTFHRDLFFAWTAPNDGDYTFDTCGGTAYDTRLAVLSDCGTCVIQNDDFCGLQSSVTITGLNAGDALLIQVGGFGSGNWGPGALNVTEFIDPCSGSTDGFEDNDACIDANVITPGSYPGLRIESDDDDYYSINVPDLATLTAQIKFLNANGDTDIFLYENLGNCQLDEGAALHGCANTLACGFSVSDNEIAAWTNTTGAAVDVLIQVKLWTQLVCNDYDLVVNVNAGGDVGTNYCNANANSSGVPAKMSASGSANVAANDLVLECNNMPTIAPFNIWNYFAMGTAQDYVVLAVEQGNLCIGGTVGRFTGPGQVTNAGMTGSASLAVDLNALPNGIGAPLPGDTLYFTNYYRDVNPNPTSNLADGLSVTFN
jgi:hypothetical protein